MNGWRKKWKNLGDVCVRAKVCIYVCIVFVFVHNISIHPFGALIRYVIYPETIMLVDRWQIN